MIKVFLHELKLRRKSLVLWSISIIVFMIMSFAKYNTLAADAQASEQLIKQFPQTIQAIFGMSGLDMTAVTGYFGTLYLFILLMVAVHAGLSGVDVVIHDERDRTSEFIYTKPISRLAVLTQKIAAGLASVICIWIVTAIAAWVSMAQFVPSDTFEAEFWLFFAAIALVQWLFFALGIGIAGMSGQAKLSTRIIAGVVFGSYLLYAFGKLSVDNAWALHLSVFSWFDAVDILKNMELSFGTVAISAICGLALIIIGYTAYLYRDIRT